MLYFLLLEIYIIVIFLEILTLLYVRTNYIITYCTMLHHTNRKDIIVCLLSQLNDSHAAILYCTLLIPLTTFYSIFCISSQLINYNVHPRCKMKNKKKKKKLNTENCSRQNTVYKLFPFLLTQSTLILYYHVLSPIVVEICPKSQYLTYANESTYIFLYNVHIFVYLHPSLSCSETGKKLYIIVTF